MMKYKKKGNKPKNKILIELFQTHNSLNIRQKRKFLSL